MADTQPLAPTDAKIENLGHRMCWRYKHSTDPNHSSTYTFNRLTLLDFARTILAKWGAQPVVREPLTDEQIREWWASENGLEDCEMCKLEDFLLVVRAVEEKHGIKGGQHGAE